VIIISIEHVNMYNIEKYVHIRKLLFSVSA